MTSRSAEEYEPAVAVGSSQRPWVAELMSYAQDHAGVRVIGTILSGREAVEQTYDVLLIDDTTSYLTKRLIDRVHLLRRIVIGVYESDRGETGRHKLLEMGADAVIEAGSTPRDFLARIRHLTEQRIIDRDFEEIVAEDPLTELPEPLGEGPSGSASSGRVVVVSGSNGTTEVVVGLATTLARSGASVAVADLDTVDPAIAQRLGVALSPNVLTAAETLRHDGTSDGFVAHHPAGFGVLAGLPSPREWESLAPDDAADLVSELAEAHGLLIVRVNRQLEDLAPFGVRAGRFAVARRLVAEAGHLVVVGDPSPVGVTAVLAWVGDARGLSSAPIHVVLNHCGRSLYQHGEITQEITRTFRSSAVVFAPEDHRVRKASWQGEAPPPGRFLKALEGLAVQTEARVAAPSTGPT